MLFDIHTKNAAEQTLFQLTGIPIEQWAANKYREQDYRIQDDFVEAMIREHGATHLPQSYMDLDYVFLHITTSSDNCTSIKRNGILDLKKVYECNGSELRRFFDSHGISINLDAAILNYQGQQYDIHYGDRPLDEESVEDKCWSVGSKFYYDFATCGFLSISSSIPYGGQIQRQPEILFDIDELLGTNLSDEWARTHSPYGVIAKVSGANIFCPFNDDASDAEKIMAYVVMAYNEAFNGSSENILLLKNGIQIPPSDIISISSFDIWK